MLFACQSVMLGQREAIFLSFPCSWNGSSTPLIFIGWNKDTGLGTQNSLRRKFPSKIVKHPVPLTGLAYKCVFPFLLINASFVSTFIKKIKGFICFNVKYFSSNVFSVFRCLVVLGKLGQPKTFLVNRKTPPSFA